MTAFPPPSSTDLSNLNYHITVNILQVSTHLINDTDLIAIEVELG